MGKNSYGTLQLGSGFSKYLKIISYVSSFFNELKIFIKI